MFSDPHLHYPYALSDHAERAAIAQRQRAARAGAPVVALFTLPLVRRPLLRAAVRSLGRRADGVSRVSRPATKHAQRSAVLSK